MFQTINGVQLHTVAFGRGPRTLVASGGWTGNWELWEAPFELLTAAGWRCLSYDHRGAGESPVEPELITVQAMADDIIGLMDAHGIEECLLAGESMGGAIAQLAALQHPERFTGLVLVASAPATFDEGRAAFAARARVDYPSIVHRFIDNCLPEADSEHIRRWGRNILLRAEPEQAARLLEMWGDAPPIDPTRLALPTLIIHGALDAIIPLEHARELERQISNSELLVLDDAGHVPTLTRAREVVDAIGRYFPATTRLV